MCTKRFLRLLARASTYRELESKKGTKVKKKKKKKKRQANPKTQKIFHLSFLFHFSDPGVLNNSRALNTGCASLNVRRFQ
jgi:hypothetical protein